MMKSSFRSHRRLRRPEIPRMSYITHEGSRPTSRTRSRGFTLIEIMVVMVIIGLLAAFIVPTVLGKVDEARVTKAKGDIQALEADLTLFYLDNSKYQTTEHGISEHVQKRTIPGIKKVKH